MPNYDLPPEQKRALSVEPQADALRIAWADGHVSAYPYDGLRRKCPCAMCMGEFGSPGVIDLSGPLSASQTQVVGITPIGRYAISLEWADGHNTGLYSYQYLRRIDPARAV